MAKHPKIIPITPSIKKVNEVIDKLNEIIDWINKMEALTGCKPDTEDKAKKIATDLDNRSKFLDNL